MLRQLRKQNKKGNSFPGGFSTNIIPMLILQAMDQFQTYKQDVCKTVTFVSDVDVQAFITHFHNKWYFNEILFFIV